MQGLVMDENQTAAASSYLNKLMKGLKDGTAEGEHDPATMQLRNYMKTEGVIDIQRFRNEYKSKQMKSKIPKELVLQNASPLRGKQPSPQLRESELDRSIHESDPN